MKCTNKYVVIAKFGSLCAGSCYWFIEHWSLLVPSLLPPPFCLNIPPFSLTNYKDYFPFIQVSEWKFALCKHSLSFSVSCHLFLSILWWSISFHFMSNVFPNIILYVLFLQGRAIVFSVVTLLRNIFILECCVLYSFALYVLWNNRCQEIHVSSCCFHAICLP